MIWKKHVIFIIWHIMLQKHLVLVGKDISILAMEIKVQL
jgi:hypothetical protein